MKILLIVSAFNSLTQRVFVKLQDTGHTVSVQFAIDDHSMIDAVNSFSPDIIICPYLKKFIPKEIFTNIPTYILHPGIRGDKGHHSLDHAIKDKKEKWGVVLLRANEHFDGGDIYSEVIFHMRDTYKASLYRDEVSNATIKAIDKLLENINNKDFIPTKQLNTQLHHYLSNEDRAINWQKDTTKQIINKIYQSDSYPGVLDNILDIKCFLFGAWEEEKLIGKPKEILAKRDGAICLGTIDGAVWITLLKTIDGFKLPSTYVLKDKIKGIKEDRLPLIFDMSYKTFYEIGSHKDGEVSYLCFNFHNGAMNSEQCIRLKYAFDYLKEDSKVIVLIGARDFFSNGIHLNILEDSKKQGEDGWSNINAMNDLIKSIIFADDVITVSSLHKNAGAGGVFLALACDYVTGASNTVLNPHYKTIGLTGSEYHTYTLPKRVGTEKANKLLDECLPISIEYAKNINMVDEIFELDNYFDSLRTYCSSLLNDEDKYYDFIYEKQDYLEENKNMINQYKEDEIKTMYPQFWKKDSLFHKLRYNFVYKKCQIKTPRRLIYKGKENA